MNEKHVFAGNNTSKGFCSYFGDIIQPEVFNHIYILKGGPGVGKSTFMRKFATHMSEKGHSIEYVHCSSDNKSLDGVIVTDLKIVFVDGTAPHTIDPVVPGAVDEIINLGVYLNSKQLEQYKEQILDTKKSISRQYTSAYRFLECAGLIQDEINSIYNRYTCEKEYLKLSKQVIDKLFSENKPQESSGQSGKSRRLFSEAYTADGYNIQTDTLCHGKKIWGISGINTDYISKLLDNVASHASSMGYYTEGYYLPLQPQKLQHLVIPELNVILRSIDDPQSRTYEEVINMNSLMDLKQIENYKDEITNNRLLFDMLIENALERLSNTKKMHDELEFYYKNSVDFKGVDRCLEEIISRY